MMTEEVYMMSEKQVIKGSQRYATAALLRLCGGFLDAYTYFSRGGVFANAQTGNMIKLGISAATGDYSACIRYLIPIISFILGILLVRIIDSEMTKRKIRHIRRTVILTEAAVLLTVMLIPQKEELNIIANTLVSFVCAMQMEAFKSFGGEVLATVVNTGNLRKAVEYMYEGIKEKDSRHLMTSLRYLVITILFITGVFTGTRLTIRFGVHAMLFPVILLTAVFVIITVSYRHILQEEKEQRLR